MATAEFAHLQKLVGRLEELGADPAEAMQAFQASFDGFHAHTAPSDFYEGLIKAYVGDGLAADFYREIAAYLDPETREVIIARSRTPVRRRSSSSGSAPASPRTTGSVAGWRCGDAG